MTRSPRFRTGVGFDAHAFGSSPKRKLRLGGVHIPFPKGLAGHSDADALLHAVTDALLGALALPDIGTRFPDTDPRFKDADSAVLLTEVVGAVRKRGYRVMNLDCIVVCDRPRLTGHSDAIRSRIAGLLGTGKGTVGFKAKTCEGTMLAIPGKSIAALATALLARKPEAASPRPQATGLRGRTPPRTSTRRKGRSRKNRPQSEAI